MAAGDVGADGCWDGPCPVEQALCSGLLLGKHLVAGGTGKLDPGSALRTGVGHPDSGIEGVEGGTPGSTRLNLATQAVPLPTAYTHSLTVPTEMF